MIVDAQMHADEEDFLLEDGSEQGNLWGINIRPYETSEKFIEFDSMINMRPGWGNNSRGVDDPKMRERIIKIVNKLVQKC